MILVFTDEETKTRSSLKSHSKLVAESDLDPDLPSTGACSTLGCLPVRLSIHCLMVSECRLLCLLSPTHHLTFMLSLVPQMLYHFASQSRVNQCGKVAEPALSGNLLQM